MVMLLVIGMSGGRGTQIGSDCAVSGHVMAGQLRKCSKPDLKENRDNDGMTRAKHGGTACAASWMDVVVVGRMLMLRLTR